VTDDEALLRAYDEQLRARRDEQPGLTVEADGPLVRVAGQVRGFVDGPRDLGVTGAELDVLIARQQDFFAARGEAVEWKTRGHDLPADLPQRLLIAGFVPEEQETVLVGVAADMAGDPVLPAGVTLRRVTTEADLRAVAAMESEIWDEDWGWLADELTERVKSAPDDLAVFAVEDQASGRVVSAAWVSFTPGTDFAGLWGGSTLTPWRGRGIYRALVAVRARLAVRRGVRYLQVDASDDSAPILRRLGFRAITTTTPYVWTPPAAR
jgi:GNAT superfamily N-acetyltransferase